MKKTILALEALDKAKKLNPQCKETSKKLIHDFAKTNNEIIKIRFQQVEHKCNNEEFDSAKEIMEELKGIDKQFLDWELRINLFILAAERERKKALEREILERERLERERQSSNSIRYEPLKRKKPNCCCWKKLKKKKTNKKNFFLKPISPKKFISHFFIKFNKIFN